MIGKIDEVVIDCQHPGPMAAFWAGVLGGDPQARDPEWAYLDAPGWTRLAFQRVPEAKTVKNRLHIDVEVADIPAATAQAIALGARPIGEIITGDPGSFQVLLDPEDNEFCLVCSVGNFQ